MTLLESKAGPRKATRNTAREGDLTKYPSHDMKAWVIEDWCNGIAGNAELHMDNGSCPGDSTSNPVPC